MSKKIYVKILGKLISNCIDMYMMIYILCNRLDFRCYYFCMGFILKNYINVIN